LIKVKLDGVVLDAPFLNANKVSKDFYVLPRVFTADAWIHTKIEKALKKAQINFRNDQQ
jgi:hypothetical protein